MPFDTVMSIRAGISGLSVGVGLAVLLSARPAAADEAAVTDLPEHGSGPPVFVDVSGSYYVPTSDSRLIDSVFLNAAVGIDVFPKIGLSAYGGLSLTYATGHILQWNDHFEDVRYETEAGGVGPIFLLRWAPFRIANVAVAGEMVGGIVIYSNGFPAGGDVYNFTWRFGGSLSYQVNDALFLNAGVRWMHVSNGQGLGPQNPSYEGIGFPIGATLTL
jgi:hypothetical protein